MASPQRTRPGYYIAVIVLAGLLIAAATMVVGMAMRPKIEPAAASVLTDHAASSCPTGQQDGTCFSTVVTNTGGTAADFRCVVSAIGDEEVTFTDGRGLAEFPLNPGQSETLTTVVVAHGSTVEAAPRVGCSLIRS